jgi:murein DD-endopeptidase MepM/ murein hydrolase activator NlpD
MKKFFYYCSSKQRLIEVKNAKSKILAYFTFIIIVSSGLFLGGYNFISSFTDSYQNSQKLKEENELLKAKILEITSSYKKLNNELSFLVKENNDLRLAVNLPPISDDERQVGVGGGYFDNLVDFSDENNLNNILSFIDEVSRKISYEKTNYKEISTQLARNKKLFSSLPAIKPCTGTLGQNGFGLRDHPILNIEKMHDGIDIITDIGTKVYASGDGLISFVGISGGYGLTIEIDHGFGYITRYAHLSDVSVKEGDKIKRGKLIAISGNSGLSTGPHLHYEVHHNGVKLNPREFFFDDVSLFDITSKN